MGRKNGRLNELAKAGEVTKHRRVAPKTVRKGQVAFRTFRLRKGIRIEKAAKSIS